MTFIDTANTCSGCQARDEYIQTLEAENQRLDEHSKQWGIKAQQAEADAKRLEWAKNNPRQFYEICQQTLMSRVDEDVAIDNAANLTLQEALDWQKTQNQRIVELASSVQFWQDRSERIAEDKMDLARRNAELGAKHSECVRMVNGYIAAESNYLKEIERLQKALHSISSSTAPR